MRARTAWCLGFLLVAGPVGASEPQGKLVKETWDGVYMQGTKVGYERTWSYEIERDGQKLLRASGELNLRFRRYGAVAQGRQERGTEETREGKVVGVFMRQPLDQGKEIV